MSKHDEISKMLKRWEAEAQAEIDRRVAERTKKLKAKVERLRKVLEQYANHCNWMEDSESNCDELYIWCKQGNGYEIAEAALKGGGE